MRAKAVFVRGFGFVVVLAILLSGGSLGTATDAKAEWTHPLGGPYEGCGYSERLNGNYCETLEASCEAVARFRAAGGSYQLTKIEVTGDASADCYWSGAWSVYSPEPTYAYCAGGELYNNGRANNCQPWEDNYEEFGACEDCPGSEPSPMTGKPEPSPMVGNPINTTIGNKFEQVTDYRSSGPDELEFTRYYSSTPWTWTKLGFGWRHSYSRWLWLKPDGVMHAARPDGRIPLFVDSGGGNWVPHSLSGPDTKVRLLQTPSGYELVLEDDTVETYDSAGDLLSIEKKNGYAQTINRNADGTIATVTDSHGRTLTLDYQIGFRNRPVIRTMTDPDGRVYRYEYQGINQYEAGAAVLNKVIYPDDDDLPLGVADAPLGPNDVLYTHLDGPDGATTAIDESPGNHTLTFVGAAQIDTAQSHLGGASALFDGTLGTYISAPDSEDWNFGAGQFTVEGWMRFASTVDYAGLVRHWDGPTDQRSWGVDWAGGNIRFIYSTAGTTASEGAITASWTPTLGVWHHIAADRDAANRLRVYVDGKVLIDTVLTATFHNSVDGIRVGQKMDGWVDEVRVTKGEARYGEAWDTLENNPFVTYHYEDSRYGYALTGITDETGQRTATWAYDASARATLTEHAGGVDSYQISGYTYDPNTGARTATVTGPLGKQLVYTHAEIASDPKLTSVERLASASTPAATRSFTYDGNGFLASATDWNGVLTTYVNNSRGLQTSRTEALGTPEERTVTTTWDPDFRVPSQIVAPERTTDMTYYPDGLLHTRTVTDTTSHSVPYPTNGQTRTWTYTYNAQGLVETVDGPLPGAGDTTTYAYDPVTGVLTSTTNSVGHVTQITSHDASSRPLTTLDANNVETTLAYDARGRLKTRTVDSGAGGTAAVTQFTYDLAGTMTGMTLPDGSSLTYEYDAADRLTAIENDLGERIEYGYDDMGNRTAQTVKDASLTIVRQATATFDDLGRMLKSIGAYVGEETVYAWDANGNAISVTDPLSNVTGSDFDALNRLVTVTDALLNTASYGYDAAGNRETATDQRGLVTSYVHNGFGEVIQQSSPDTGVTVYEYDSAGRRTRRTDARGVVTDWTYDDLGRTLTMTFPASPAENVTYAYDDATPGHYGIGRLASVTDDSGSTSYRYDARGNTVWQQNVVGAQTYVTQYAYDLADRLTQMTYPSGRIVDYARDSIGRVSGVTTKADAGAPAVTLAANIGYEPFGPSNAMDYGNGVTLANGFDLDGRLAAIDAFDGVTPVLDLDYAFDLAGNITDIDDIGGGSRGRDFAYDELHRLTQGKELAPGGAPVTLQTDYSYDAVGNRLTRDVGGALETLAYDAFSNRLATVTAGAAVRTLGYSDSGNTASDDDGLGTVLTHNYDSADRLVEVKQGASTLAEYVHNAIGQRVSKDTGGGPSGVTHYVYDLSGRLIAEHGGKKGAVQAEYVAFNGINLAYITTGAIYWVHGDHLGTPQVLTDDTKAVVWDANYRPFGEATVTGALAFNLRFPGQYHDDETGMHYNYLRTYDPGTGRYTESDPIGLAGGWNSYAYVGGNPVMRVDPKGLYPSCFVKADCLAQATANWINCLNERSLFGALANCGAALATCEPVKARPRLYILCLISRAASCMAAARYPCDGQYFIESNTCESSGGISGYRYQDNYDYIPGCGCISEPDYKRDA